jgi:hypothetical protein
MQAKNPNTGNWNDFNMKPVEFVDADGVAVYTIAIYCNGEYVVSLVNENNRPFAGLTFDVDLAIAQTLLHRPDLIK